MDEMDALIDDLRRQLAEKDKQIEDLQRQIAERDEKIHELESRLGQNSSNSSRPPSTDGFNSPNRSLREKSGRRPGAPNGHPGSHLGIPHAPDETVSHFPAKCQSCPFLQQCHQNGDVFKCAEKRYELNVIVKTKVTEHRLLEVTSCPCEFGEKLKGQFPDNIRAYVQYGDSFAVLAGLLSTYGAVSAMRIHVLLGSLFGVSTSPATILSMVSKCAHNVGPVLETIRKLLAGSDVVHFDETGTHVNGSTQWVHNSSTGKLTLLTINRKRGKDGMDDNGVLPLFDGTAIHDCWGPYWGYQNIVHAVCLAHLLRELKAIEEFSPGHTWAGLCKNLLLEMKRVKDKAVSKGKNALSYYYLHKFDTEYDRIMQIADKECPAPSAPPDKKSGRKKKGKERALIERLIALKASVCLFVHDFRVPFDNNQAERDVRNVKTKTKVSGGFRTEDGAKDYVAVTSFLSTARKNNISVFEALTAAFNGNPEIVLCDGGSE